MSEEKKQEEKRYAYLSKESIKLYAEQTGHSDITDEIAALLAEDVNYRLREATQNSCQYMRHSKRRKLTTEDFNKAMRVSDVQPVYGHGCVEPVAFYYVKEADVYCMEDREINLCSLATSNHVFQQPGQPSLKAQWLAVEGVPKGSTTTPTNQASSKKNGHVVQPVSEELLLYYDNLTKAILGSDEELMKIALEDLRTNAKIASLLPYFVNFVSNGVKTVSHDLMQLTKLMHTAKSLISNPSLYLGPKPYLNLLVSGVLYCILEPLAVSINPINDHWALRDYAARLLAHIVRSWTTPVNRLKQHALTALKDAFKDIAKPFCSHYGAIIGLITFGPKALDDILYPLLEAYWPHLQSALEDNSYSNAQLKADAQKVYGALLLAAELLIRTEHSKLYVTDGLVWNCTNRDDSSCDNPVSIDKQEFTFGTSSSLIDLHLKSNTITDNLGHYIKPSTLDRYQQLYDYFGDSLAMRLPYIQVDNFYLPKSEPLVPLTSDDAMMSGEQLLEMFTEHHEDDDSSMDDDKSLDDRDDSYSFMSDDTTPMDLTVKSTVNDPALGIKVTIAKRPRVNPEQQQPVKTHGKRRKLCIRVIRDQEVFEPPVLRDQEIHIDFNFEGAVSYPVSKLLRPRTIRIIRNDPFVYQTEVRRLSAKMKAIGKRRNYKGPQSNRLHQFSGDAMLMLL